MRYMRMKILKIIKLLKPMTFINDSGTPLQSLLKNSNITPKEY